MKDFSEIDKNFTIEKTIDNSKIRFYNALCYPFEINGVFYDNGKFRRMPEDVAKSVSDGVYALHANTAGGRIRFRTSSACVAINAKMSSVGKMSHFALCGSAGFDLYVGNEYAASFIPPFDITNGYEGIVKFDRAEPREITINFPLYSDVNELYIGLDSESSVWEPSPYKTEKPIVYYGSSITQGGCASRPGNTYQAIASRELNADYVNLGFSGNAKAEKEISDYIKKLPMSVFVYDYDHNAPTIEHLKSTHERMFLEIREAYPTLPIIMMSRPKYHLNDDDASRYEIIKRTYENAVLRGDKNVYLIDGPALMKLAEGNGTVDGCHPTDLGFFSMAKAIIGVLRKIL